MKEHNKHSIDQKLEKKFSDYKESPSDELWGRIKHEMDASSGNSSEELNGKKGGFKPWNKPFFWVGAAIVTASVLFYSVNLGKENVSFEDDKDIVVAVELEIKNEEPDWFVSKGETILNVLPEYNSLYNLHEVAEHEYQGNPIVNAIMERSLSDQSLNGLGKGEKEGVKNLVRNGSFEQYIPIPHRYDNKVSEEPWVRFSQIPYWEAGGIPDYYHPRNNGPNMWNNAPKSAHGQQSARVGVAYIGLIAHSKSGYREYRFTKLRKPLKKGEKYCVSMYVVKGDHGDPIKQLGMYFSKKKIDFEAYKKGDMKIKESQFVYNNKAHIGDQSTIQESSWRKVNRFYIAQGGEKYLYLGSMLPIDKVSVQKGHNKKVMDQKRLDDDYSYYFFDDISVFPYHEKLDVCQCEEG